MLWLETPTNPLMQLADIRELGARSKPRGIRVVVDNTFMTPYFQRPLELGADVVVHSVTKYLNGHSDMVGGAVVTSDEAFAEQLRFLQNAAGAVPGPMDCFLCLRGTKTLAVRMRQHEANARVLAAGARGAPAGQPGLLPGPRVPSAARARPPAGLGLRRHDLVHPRRRLAGRRERRSSTASGCSRAPRAWAESRASSAIRRP